MRRYGVVIKFLAAAAVATASAPAPELPLAICEDILQVLRRLQNRCARGGRLSHPGEPGIEID
jgi:hypothetical protein